MTTYYEILQIQPTASIAEIQAAVDEQYNQWRRLTTHHDPIVVNQANQALQALETIRSTLTDPGKRTVYDSAIGLNGIIGGVADPGLILKQSSSKSVISTSPKSPPTQPVQFTGPSASIQRMDAWICPKCHKSNSTGAQFCEGCGNRIGDSCPKCGKITELVNAYCPACGADKKAFSQMKTLLRNEIKDFESRILAIQTEIQFLERFKSGRMNKQDGEYFKNFLKEYNEQPFFAKRTIKHYVDKRIAEKYHQISQLEQQIHAINTRLYPS
jgi:hypothetical protein